LLNYGRTNGSKVAGLSRSFNLEPAIQRWFPEVGDLTTRPPIGALTEKRRVKIDEFWREKFVRTATPTHFVQVMRSESSSEVDVSSIPTMQLLPSILRQTVIPRDVHEAQHIVEVIAGAASHLRGLRAKVPIGAYGRADGLKALEDALL
jgi:hypothetical protein